MDLDPQDQTIINLLAKLKDADPGGYPQDLLASRRQLYLSQIANIGLGIAVNEGLKQGAKGPQNGGLGANISSTFSTIIEAVLVTAIVVEAGITAYKFRDKIADFLSPATPTLAVSQDANIPVTGSSEPEVAISDTPQPSETITDTPISTATTVPALAGSGNGNGTTSNSGSNGGQVSATDTPKKNNGNHYGQTPKPTKDTSTSGATKVKNPPGAQNTPKPTKTN